MYKVFLSLGSNLGNRIINLQNVLQCISEHIGDIKSVGALYETEPWGFDSENWFVNTAIEIETVLQANVLLQKCLWIESTLGRKRNKAKVGYSSRLIDIDILFFDNEIINLPNLIVPHENLHKRKFVLTPLNDIAPEFVHPIIKQSIRTLLESCPDKMKLKKLNLTLG
ncbi:MAG: 2-amino-4-hydroxy-6-hydroxymethyldihydropteridine diphosphokinase [Bacteroidetes bacterium]|nr:MAG: 2-amino-4-hydroxy-6-hydroxymethyldihydropteridine diphosphokinase [Bacteroidota bacterium]